MEDIFIVSYCCKAQCAIFIFRTIFVQFFFYWYTYLITDIYYLTLVGLSDSVFLAEESRQVL